jgi:hypothetical protein
MDRGLLYHGMILPPIVKYAQRLRMGEWSSRTQLHLDA